MGIQQDRQRTPAVILKQHQAPGSYIVTTLDETHLRKNRIHLPPIVEQTSLVTCPAWEPASNECSPLCHKTLALGSKATTAS